jgi:succinate dehydrogenase / fumarate reductase cytochrome b subunit
MNALTRSATAYWNSSIGKKLVVALTGLAMVLFLAGHLTGNLLMYAGKEAFDEYARFLHEAGHGALIWVARLGLLVVLVLHVWATILGWMSMGTIGLLLDLSWTRHCCLNKGRK